MADRKIDCVPLSMQLGHSFLIMAISLSFKCDLGFKQSHETITKELIVPQHQIADTSTLPIPTQTNRKITPKKVFHPAITHDNLCAALLPRHWLATLESSTDKRLLSFFALNSAAATMTHHTRWSLQQNPVLRTQKQTSLSVKIPLNTRPCTLRVPNHYMDTQTHTPASQHSTRKKLLLTCSNLLHSPQFSTDTATASKTSLELQTLNHVVLRSHNKCAQPSKMRCMPAAKTQSGSLILPRHRKTTLSGQKQFQNTSRTAKPLQPLVCCRDSGQAPAVHDASMAPRILLRCGHGDDARSPDHTAFTCSPCSHICLSAMRHSSTPQSPRHTSLPTYHHKTCKPGLSTACFNTCTLPPGGGSFLKLFCLPDI